MPLKLSNEDRQFQAPSLSKTLPKTFVRVKIFQNIILIKNHISPCQ